MPKLKKAKPSKQSASVSLGWARWSSINANENGTYRIDIDYYVDEADFLAGNSPFESKQIEANTIPGINGINNVMANHPDFEV